MAYEIAHVEMNVSDIKKSVAFYDRLFAFLGFSKKHEFKDGAGWSNDRTSVFIFQADGRFIGRPFAITPPGPPASTTSPSTPPQGRRSTTSIAGC